MKSKQKRLAYGLYQDGLSIKLAELTLSNNKVTIKRLARATLPAALYEEVAELPPDLESIEENLEIPDITDIVEPESSEPPKKGEEERPKTAKAALQEFLLPFSLERGRIALNAKEENVSYHTLEPITTNPKSIKKQIQRELLEEPDVHLNNTTFDYVHDVEGNITAILHRGECELLNALREINKIIAKKKFFFSSMVPNEIALMNLVRRNYVPKDEEYTWIVYVDKEYKACIVMKGRDYVRSFPIIITGINENRGIKEIVFSKLMMEQDVSNFPPPQCLLLGGDNVSEEEVQFFQEKYPKALVEILSIQNAEVHANNGEITKGQIGDYAIPIALAWQTLEPQNEDFFQINLLPENIVEEQKHFKIAWHGFLVMGAIFFFAFTGTVQYETNIQQINEARSRNLAKETELTQYKGLANQIEKLQKEIAIQEQRMGKTKNLTEDRNLWYYILYQTADSITTAQLTWLNDIRAEENGFRVNGYTGERSNILGFSKLFPNGKINYVNNLEILDVPIYEFSLNFSYPTSESAKINLPKTISTVANYQVDKTTVKQKQEVMAPLSEDATKDLDEIEGYYLSISQKYLEGGNINEVYNSLVQFVKDYSEHPLAYNAQYLMGECLYQLGRIDEAITQFELVLQYEGSKLPDALMMLGNCYIKKNLPNMALVYWNQLIQNFPENNLASIAKTKIHALKH